MERARSKSIDLSFMGPGLLTANLQSPRTNRKSIDNLLGTSLLVPNLLESRSRYGSRKSLDAGRPPRRPSRVSIDHGTRGAVRGKLSYDAWLRGIRVSKGFALGQLISSSVNVLLRHGVPLFLRINWRLI